jgi:hypothetical protein
LYLLLFILGIFISVTRLGVGRWAWVLGVLTLSAPNDHSESIAPRYKAPELEKGELSAHTVTHVRILTI